MSQWYQPSHSQPCQIKRQCRPLQLYNLVKVCFHGQPSYMHNILDQLSRKVGKVLLRYCSPSHKKVTPCDEFRQPTITSDKSSFQLFNSFNRRIFVDLALNMIHLLETRSIFKRRCCIQLRTSSSSSASVSFRPPP